MQPLPGLPALLSRVSPAYQVRALRRTTHGKGVPQTQGGTSNLYKLQRPAPSQLCQLPRDEEGDPQQRSGKSSPLSATSQTRTSDPGYTGATNGGGIGASKPDGAGKPTEAEEDPERPSIVPSIQEQEGEKEKARATNTTNTNTQGRRKAYS